MILAATYLNYCNTGECHIYISYMTGYTAKIQFHMHQACCVYKFIAYYV